MKNLITADLIRILQKPTYRIALAASLLLSLIGAVRTKLDFFNSITFLNSQYNMLVLAISVILGVVIFLSVYADEFTSNSMQCLIGKGISRFKLLLAKFIDCLLVTFITFAVYGLFVTLLSLILGAHLTGYELLFFHSEVFILGVNAAGFATISMVFLYWLKNVVVATIVDLALFSFVADAFKKVFDFFPLIKHLHLEYGLFENAVRLARADMLLFNGSAFFTIIWELIKVSVIALLLSYLLFRKKELDF